MMGKKLSNPKVSSVWRWMRKPALIADEMLYYAKKHTVMTVKVAAMVQTITTAVVFTKQTAHIPQILSCQCLCCKVFWQN